MAGRDATKMPRQREDKAREERIFNEILADCYGPEEQAMGWHCYLADTVHFPFVGRCIKERRTSPLQAGQEVKVVKMARETDCMHEMLVEIKWSARRLAVPLSQIEAVSSDHKTREAILDWQYWMSRGYELT